MTHKGSYKGITSIVWETDEIKAEFLPSYGGKLASLISKKTNKEYLFQSEQEKLKIPTRGSNFSEYDSSGFDEVFPSIDTCPYPVGTYKGVIIGDHGDLWDRSWRVEERIDYLYMEIVGDNLPFIFSKKVRVENNSVKIEYQVENTSEEEFHFIWTPHALLNCSTDSVIELPKYLDKVISVEKSSVHLGQWGSIHNYPMTKSEKTNNYINLSEVEGVEAKNCEKFYFLSKVKNRDKISFVHKDIDEKISYVYDTEKIPYLGVWKTQGGYRGDYNIALEPCSGIYDDLYVAHKIGKSSIVGAKDKFTWDFNMIIEEI